jgi:sec-independent protein translocase protein TatB
MFDFGFSELLFTAVVALLVLGPDRLPRAAKVAGLWVRRARASWHSMKSQVERELADDELRRSLRDTRQQFDQMRDELRQPLDGMRQSLDELRQPLIDPERRIAPALPAVAGDATDAPPDVVAPAAAAPAGSEGPAATSPAVPERPTTGGQDAAADGDAPPDAGKPPA